MSEPCQHCDEGPMTQQWIIYWGKKTHIGHKCLACGNLTSDVRDEEELRKLSDDLDIGDMTLLDFIHAETHLEELRSILIKLPVATYADILPKRWHDILVNGIDDVREWQEIAKIQGKTED